MVAPAQVAILPPAETTFWDANGVPLAGGSVQFYIPSTTTPKDTWTNSTGVTLNTNPVILDAGGRALIWGTGSYRQLVKDSLGNTIWDQVTNYTVAGGYLIGVRTFQATTTYTPTSGTNSVIVEVLGGGGGGGGCAITGASQNSIATGGAGGGYARKRITSAFSGVTITIGAKGTGGAIGANNGTAGGTSSFGALVSSTGGAAGNGAAAAAIGTTRPFAAGGVGAGGDILAQGGYAYAPVYVSVGSVTGSCGGQSFYSAGAAAVSVNATGSDGTDGVYSGTGGSGGANAQNQAAGHAGGDGVAGLVIVWEYS